ncbi:hypothetical protein B0H13DRAFT_1892403 [Mycena leptocephala]|nr:hypothetical protein B0H13DRAFT_1892403 [Mycena leptocephala]
MLTHKVSSNPDSDSLRKSIGVDSFDNELSQLVRQTITGAQRENNRMWAPFIKEQLLPQHKRVLNETCRGMFTGMKGVFRNTADKVKFQLLGGLKQVLRQIELFFVGLPNDTDGVILVEKFDGHSEDLPPGNRTAPEPLTLPTGCWCNKIERQRI